LIKKRKKVLYVMVPSKWKHAIAELRINKPFTIVEIEQPHFKDLEVVESTMKWDQNLKITQVLWLRFSADDPAAFHVRKSHIIMQPWERYSVMKPRIGNHPHHPPAPVCRPEDLPVVCSTVCHFLSVKKRKPICLICAHTCQMNATNITGPCPLMSNIFIIMKTW
jgi:hypothetical protein